MTHEELLTELNILIQQQREQIEAAAAAAKEEHPLYEQRLLDEFAMSAMNGLLAAKNPLAQSDIAELAYQQAHAMMRCRRKDIGRRKK